MKKLHFKIKSKRKQFDSTFAIKKRKQDFTDLFEWSYQALIEFDKVKHNLINQCRSTAVILNDFLLKKNGSDSTRIVQTLNSETRKCFHLLNKHDELSKRFVNQSFSLYKKLSDYEEALSASKDSVLLNNNKRYFLLECKQIQVSNFTIFWCQALNSDEKVVIYFKR